MVVYITFDGPEGWDFRQVPRNPGYVPEITVYFSSDRHLGPINIITDSVDLLINNTFVSNCSSQCNFLTLMIFSWIWIKGWHVNYILGGNYVLRGLPPRGRGLWTVCHIWTENALFMALLSI